MPSVFERAANLGKGMPDYGSGVQEIPQKGWQKKGTTFLKQLLKEPTVAPVQQIAPMSANEQAGQVNLANILSGGAFQDPATSRVYESFRNESQREEASLIDALRRRSQLSGVGASSGAFGAEARARQDASNSRLGMLGGLFEAERARDNEYTRAAAAQQLGALPRLIEQAGLNAQQEAELLNAIQIPYQYKTSIAQSLMGNQPTLYAEQQSNSGGGVGGLLGGIGSLLGGLF